MDKLLRLAAYAGLAASALGFHHVAQADIQVTISDGWTEISPSHPAPKNGFTLQKSSPAVNPPKDDFMTLLNCTTRPCTIFFPSGDVNQGGEDTFAFSDTCKPGSCSDAVAARIIKSDASGGGLTVSGLQITTLDPGWKTWMKIVVTTKGGDFTHVKAGSYPATAMLAGEFRDTDNYLAYGCPDPDLGLSKAQLMTPCVRLGFDVMGITLNNAGADAIKTVSIPCWFPPDGPLTSPCSSTGWYLSSGMFKAIDQLTFSCDDTVSGCDLYYGIKLAAFFWDDPEMMEYPAPPQALILENSALGAASRRREEDFGREDIAYTLANELGAPLWVSSIAGTEPYRASPKGLITSKSGFEFAFVLQQAALVPAKQGVTLTSLATTKNNENGDNLLPASERSRNDVSYVSYIPQRKKLQWKGVESLTLLYEVITSSAYSGDSRLQNLTFADCANASFHVLVKLTDSTGTKDAGTLKIRLGSQNDFKDGCTSADLSNANLIANPQHRVKSSSQPDKLLTAEESQSQKLFGDLYVRSISVVVDRGTVETGNNYQVSLKDVGVKEAFRDKPIYATDFILAVDASTWRNVTELPATGRSMLISEQGKLPNTTVAQVPNENFRDVGSLLAAKLPASLARGVGYRVDLCLFGGRCIPLQGGFTLPKD